MTSPVAVPAHGPAARVDAWIWAVRLTSTRTAAAAACRSGHVRVNDEKAKPAQSVRAGDEVRLRLGGRERIVTVVHPVSKRVGAPVAAVCLIDQTPPEPPPAERELGVVRDRGAGRPTKRDRRLIDEWRGRA